MSFPEPSAPDLLAQMRRDLGATITNIVGYTELLQEHAEEFGQETFLPDLQKIHTSARQLNELVHELIDASATRLEDVDFPRLRYEIRTALNHTIGYIEMLQERAFDLDQREFLPDLDKVHAACRHLLALAIAGAGPTTAEAPPLDPTVLESDLSSGADPAPLSGTILVVDDNLQSRDALGRLLRGLDYRVVNAGSGLSAMERLRAEKFDLVLLDVVMPGMNGYEVLQWLKADPGLRHIPVILIAAMNDSDNVVRCLVVGAEDYVTKPFEPNLLKTRVSACLERSRWKKQEEAYQRQIEQEQSRFQQLLLNVLPKSVMDRYRAGENAIVDHLPEVTVLFAHLQSSEPESGGVPPLDFIALLNDVFTTFDRIAGEREVERIKTFGDTYLAVGGISPAQRDHARIVADLAVTMQREVATVRAATGKVVHLRIGLHTGPVVAGIIGRHQFSYDLWGETVRIARDLQTRTAANRIRVSPATFAIIRDHHRFEELHAKGDSPHPDEIGYMISIE